MKIFFTWWNKQTFGTYLKTLFTGQNVGKDQFGNKYYKNKNDERWVVYSKNVEATKITADWYLWMHHTTDRIPTQEPLKNLVGKRSIKKTKLALIQDIILLKLKRIV